MSATRNGNPTKTAGISITPATSPAPNTRTTVNNLLTSTIIVDSNAAAAALMPQAGSQQQGVASVAQQTAMTMIAPTSLMAPRTTVLSPITALAGTSYPFIIPAIIFTPRPAPLRAITERDISEETLALDTYTFSNGKAILDVSSLRCDLISMISFRPIYDNSGRTLTTFGRYLDDLNQASSVRDSLRKYILVNSMERPSVAAALGDISAQINTDLANSAATMTSLDALIQRTKKLSGILDIKESLGSDTISGLGSPNMGLQQFMSSRMLFSDSAFTVFSDTKIIYQVLADLSGILEKCSFNLLDGFTDEERRVVASSPLTIRKQTIQDAITIDQSYGDNLSYTTAAIRLKYMNSTVDMNGLLNVLPSGSRNRFKFIINLLSKEFKVSKGLGKPLLSDQGGDARYFGIGAVGNPFDNIIGRVPSDIFLAPLGQNSLASLFYIKGGASNVVILPFESRQVVGDNETVFVPGATYFSDSILKGNFDTYNSYRDIFGTRFANAQSIFSRYLLNQSGIDNTSANLDPKAMLKNALRLYNDSQSYIRKDNNDPTTLLTFVMILVSNGDPSIKFEVYKLLLLITLYDSRPTNTQTTAQTDKFRDLLYGEVSGQTIQGFSAHITEGSISSLLSTQIEIVKRLVLGKISPLSVSSSQNNIGQQKSTTGASINRAQKQQLGLPVPSAQSNTTRNQNNNTATVQVQQFSRLADALKGNQNLFKNTIDFARTLFTAASTNDTAYHLLDNSSVSRYNGMTMSGFLLLAFELFGNLAEQFARTTVIYNLIDGAGGKSESSQYIQLSYIGNELSSTSDSIKQYIAPGGIYSNPIIADYDKKLGEEEQIIGNILAFFDRINQNLSSVTSLSISERNALNLTTANNARTIASTRTAKSILQSFTDKKKLYNPNDVPAANFYLPSGKAISDKSYAALKVALRDHSFLTGRKKIISVGIPNGFTQAAMGARLDKTDAYQGNLQRNTSDIAQVSIHKLDKHDEGIVYKPITYKFDLSLFARGYDSSTPETINGLDYSTLIKAFEFYDFDEDKPYSEVVAKSINGSNASYILTEPYYTTRPELGREVVSNLQTSFLLELYVHLLTGMNITEETFIRYTDSEMRGFITALRSLGTGAPNYAGVKFMSPVYQRLLSAFANSPDDFKLILTLCNDIPKSVFREKQYDRTFMVMIDVDKFVIDENAMKQKPASADLLSEMRLKNRIISSHTSYHDNQTGVVVQNTDIYKTPDSFIMDQYFAEVELVQQ